MELGENLDYFARYKIIYRKNKKKKKFILVKLIASLRVYSQNLNDSFDSFRP